MTAGIKFKNRASALLLLAAALGAFACHKKPVMSPAAEEATPRSSTVRIYGYRNTLLVKTTPQELEKSFNKNITWLNKLSSTLSLEVVNPAPDLDMSKPGQSMRINLKLLGFTFPVKMINLKYIPGKELWMLGLYGDSWVLGRLELKVVPEGSLITVTALSNVSHGLAQLADSLDLVKVVCSRIDFALATIQAAYDPSLDPKQLTGKGLRGEMFDKFFHAYDASIWINARPEEVVSRVMQEENLKKIMSGIQAEGVAECLFASENLPKWDPVLRSGEVPEIVYCPDTSVKMAGIKWDVKTFALVKPEDLENTLNMHFVVAGSFAEISLFGAPENGGTRIYFKMMMEPPLSNMDNLMDAFVSISGLPQWIRDTLLDLKANTEAAA